jgi:hypothetical protein
MGEKTWFPVFFDFPNWAIAIPHEGLEPNGVRQFDSALWGATKWL